MNLSLQKTLHQLTGHSNIADAGIDELFQLTDSHPYFSLPHFFLTQKLKVENHSAYIPQLQKTALYFTNSYWLHYQLMNNNATMEVLHKPIYQQEETKPLLVHTIEEEIQQITADSAITVQQSEATNTLETVALEEQPIINKFTAIERAEKETAYHPLQEEVTITTTALIETIEEASITENVVKEETTIIKAIEQPIINEVIIETTIVVTAQELSNFHPSITSFALESAEEVSNESADFTSFIAEQHEEELLLEDASIEEDTSIPDQKIASILKEQLEAFKKPVTEATVLQVESEPYHTIDYFASQGIKPEYDHAAQDTLSKQLRRFTDWLKHMKNVRPSNEDLGTDPELESAIQGIAQTSNEAKEIVTETMAEVLVKQGKIDKAIQLYIKLSFLNPDKSAYFASKIQSLKGI
jgi:hypothetical protein